MRATTLFFYHLSLRGLAVLGLPFLAILSFQTFLTTLDGGQAIWPRLILILGTAPMCLFFAAPALLPRRVRRPDLRDLGPFLFVGLGFAGFAVMSLAQAAIQGLTLPTEILRDLNTWTGALALLLGGCAGLLALSLCNQADGSNKPDVQTPKRPKNKTPRPSGDELRALRHARMESTSL